MAAVRWVIATAVASLFVTFSANASISYTLDTSKLNPGETTSLSDVVHIDLGSGVDFAYLYTFETFGVAVEGGYKGGYYDPPSGHSGIANIFTLTGSGRSHGSTVEYPAYSGGTIAWDASASTASFQFQVNYYSTNSPYAQVGIYPTTVQLKSVKLTTEQAIQQSILKARALLDVNKPGYTQGDLAREAYRFAINLRETTDSTDSNLRNAEYFLRGYSGGALYSGITKVDAGDLLNEVPNYLVPVSADIYVGLKQYFNTSGPLPGSVPGGNDVAVDGWQWAVAGLSLEQAVDQQFSGAQPPVVPIAFPGAPNSPLLAPTSISLPGTGFNVDLFHLSVDAGQTIFYLDPSRTTNYLFTATGLLFASVLVPNLGGADDLFTLRYGDVTMMLAEGQSFTFVAPVTSFALYGVTPDNDPASFGLTFAEAGTGFVSILGRSAGSVPEPTNWAMMVLGFGFVGGTFRRSRMRANTFTI